MSGKRGRLFLLIFVSSFFVFFQLGKLALMDLDESRYGEAAREMLILHNYIIPHLNFEPRINKPLLFYWMIILCYKLLGISEFSTRLPSAVSGFCLIVFLYLFTSQQLEEKLAFISSLVLLSSPMFVIISRLAIIDALYCSLVFISLCLFWHYFQNDRLKILAFFFLGLSMAAKGPAGLCIIFLTILVFSIVERKIYYLKKFFNPWGILIFLVVGGWWYIILGFKIGWVQFKQLAITETIGRFKSGFVHAEPFYYFLPVIFAGFLPWIIYLFKLRLKIIKENSFLRYIFCYVIVGFIFFSISKTKLPNYIFPLLPALAILVSYPIRELWEKENKLIMIVGVIILISGIIIFKWYPQFGRVISVQDIKEIAVVFTISGLIFLITARLKFRNQFIFLFMLIPFFYFYFLLQFGDDYSNYRSTRDLFVEQHIPNSENIYSLGFFKPSLVFYSRRRVVVVDSFQKAGRYLVVKKEDLPRYKGKIPFCILSENKKYALLELQKLQY